MNARQPLLALVLPILLTLQVFAPPVAAAEQCDAADGPSQGPRPHVLGNAVARCSFECPAVAVLAIHVQGHDDAWPFSPVHGDATCGRAIAHCDSAAPPFAVANPRCDGLSPPTTSAANNGECLGWSEDLFTDPLEVRCEVVSVSGVLCQAPPLPCVAAPTRPLPPVGCVTTDEVTCFLDDDGLPCPVPNIPCTPTGTAPPVCGTPNLPRCPTPPPICVPTPNHPCPDTPCAPPLPCLPGDPEHPDRTTPCVGVDCDHQATGALAVLRFCTSHAESAASEEGSVTLHVECRLDCLANHALFIRVNASHPTDRQLLRPASVDGTWSCGGTAARCQNMTIGYCWDASPPTAATTGVLGGPSGSGLCSANAMAIAPMALDVRCELRPLPSPGTSVIGAPGGGGGAMSSSCESFTQDYDQKAGGYRTACAFACDPGDVVVVFTKAGDQTAQVGADARCGSTGAECMGTGYCEMKADSFVPTTTAGKGFCQGATREDAPQIDNGKVSYGYVRCESRRSAPPALPAPIVTIGCLVDVCAPLEPATGGPRVVAASYINTFAGFAFGLRCSEIDCVSVTPTCDLRIDGRAGCRVSLGVGGP